MTYIISILIIFNLTTHSRSISFDRIDSIVLDYDWAEGITQMALVNGQAYIAIPFGYEIYVVDLSNKQNIRLLGGQGKRAR